MLNLVDETGLNPLPAGVFVSVYPAIGPQTPLTLVGSAYIEPGGSANIAVAANVSYAAVFLGTQAPTEPATFTGASNISLPSLVTCIGYRSPVLSASGYAQAESELWPYGWFGDPTNIAATAPVAYSLAVGAAQALAVVDTQAQAILGSERLQTSQGEELDSWAADVFGTQLLRYTGTSDSVYYGLILAALHPPKCTIGAVQAIVQEFYNVIGPQLEDEWAENLSYENEGGYNTRGGYDRSQVVPTGLTPTVYVWDKQSRPDLAATFGVGEPQFVIQIGLSDPYANAWFLDRSHLDNESYLLSVNGGIPTSMAPDPRLAVLVNLTKAAGTQALYQFAQTV